MISLISPVLPGPTHARSDGLARTSRIGRDDRLDGALGRILDRLDHVADGLDDAERLAVGEGELQRPAVVEVAVERRARAPGRAGDGVHADAVETVLGVQRLGRIEDALGSDLGDVVGRARVMSQNLQGDGQGSADVGSVRPADRVEVDAEVGDAAQQLGRARRGPSCGRRRHPGSGGRRGRRSGSAAGCARTSSSSASARTCPGRGWPRRSRAAPCGPPGS